MATLSEAFAWLQGFMGRITPYMNKFVIFVIILFLGFLVGKILGRLTRRILGDLHADTHLRQRLGIRLSIERFMGAAVSGAAYAISVYLALDAIGLTAWILAIVLFIISLAIVISALLAFKDIVPNAAAGLAVRRRLKPGAYLRMEGAEGTVRSVQLLETIIETPAGDSVVVPNRLFSKRSVRILKRPPARKPAPDVAQ